MEAGEGKIRYPFVPVPKCMFTIDFFRSPQLFIFVCWMFSKVSHEKRTIFFNSRVIELEAGEFIFGRKMCSEETGIGEQTIRTLAKSYLAKGMLKKVTIKSTNKFTVYMLLSACFFDSPNHQINQQLTSSQPATNHNQEYKNIDIRKQQAAFFVHNFSDLNEQATQLLAALPVDEQKRMVKLFQMRSKENPIANASGWVKKCIRHGWHLKKEFRIEPETKSQDVEKNRELAQKAIRLLERDSNIQIRLRNDFLELGNGKGKQWQIFFYEGEKAFREQLVCIFRKLNLDPEEITR